MITKFEKMDGTYRGEEDYSIPNLLPPETPKHPIGKYGLICQTYLREHRPIVYNTMVLAGTLWQYLADVDQTCNERMELLVGQMARQEGVTESLKAASGMDWVRRMNSIHSRAEEIVMREVVYE